MADKKVLLQVYTPQKAVLEEEVEYMVLPTTEGEKGVLPSHESCATLLGDGMLKIYSKRQVVQQLFVMGGIAHISADKVVILTPVAATDTEQLKEILHEMEQAEQERSQQEVRSNLEIQRAEAALRNALVQIDVSVFSVITSAPLEDEDE